MRRRTWAGRLTVGAAGGLLIGAAVPPPLAAQSPRTCRVDFTQLNEITYGSDNLKGWVLVGRHTVPASPGRASASPAPFELMDLDGFATLAALVNQWRSSGALNRNLTEAVVVPRRDVLMLADATDLGLAYHDVILGRLRRLTPQEMAPEARDGFIRDFEDRRGQLVAIRSAATTALAQGGNAASVVLPRGVIPNRIGGLLDRFLPDAPNRLTSQYRDMAVDDRPHTFCDPSADSATVGQAFCGFVFSTGARRNPNFCPEGHLVSELAPVRFCKVNAGVESDCRSSVHP